MEITPSKHVTNEYTIIIFKIESVIEYCKDIYNTVKASLIKQNKNEFYEFMDQHLSELSTLLESENYLSEEFDFFIRLKNFILYISAQNCKIENFGHLDSINYLLKLLKEFVNAKFEYIDKNISSNEYSVISEKLENDLWNFRLFFNENILIQTDEFDKDIENLNDAMRIKV